MANVRFYCQSQLAGVRTSSEWVPEVKRFAAKPILAGRPAAGVVPVCWRSRTSDERRTRSPTCGMSSNPQEVHAPNDQSDCALRSWDRQPRTIYNLVHPAALYDEACDDRNPLG